MQLDDELSAYHSQLDSAQDLAAVAEAVRTCGRRVTRADGVTFVLRDGDLCFYADEDAIAPLWKGQRFPMTECMSGWAMLNRQTAVIPDISTDERIPQDAYRSTFVQSMVMVPMRVSEPLGAIGAYWSVRRRARQDEVELLERIAAAAAERIDSLGMDTAPWAPNFRIWRPARAELAG